MFLFYFQPSFVDDYFNFQTKGALRSMKKIIKRNPKVAFPNSVADTVSIHRTALRREN